MTLLRPFTRAFESALRPASRTRLVLTAFLLGVIACAKPFDPPDMGEDIPMGDGDAGAMADTGAGDGDLVGDGDGDLVGDGDGDLVGDGDGDVVGDGDGDIGTDGGTSAMCAKTCSSILECDVFGPCKHTGCANGMCQ
jgi:hypothetical protein